MWKNDMGTTYNKKAQKDKRQYLRTHITLAEKTLWYSLKGRQLLGYKFRRQHGITDYVVDFYCPELKLVPHQHYLLETITRFECWCGHCASFFIGNDSCGGTGNRS